MSVSFKRREKNMLTIAQMPQPSSLKDLREKWDNSQIILPKKKPRKNKRKKRRKPANAAEKPSKCKFEETRLGILLRYACRTEYDLLVAMSKESKIAITPNLVEQISYSSCNPMFKTQTFRVALLSFRVKGFVKYEKNLVEEEIRLLTAKLKERGLE